MKEERIVTLGHLNPWVIKVNSSLQVRHLSWFIIEKDKALPLPKFTFLSFSKVILNTIFLFILFTKLQPFSMTNYKGTYSLQQEQVLGCVHSHLVHQKRKRDLSCRQCDHWPVSRDAFGSRRSITISSIIFWKSLCFQQQNLTAASPGWPSL